MASCEEQMCGSVSGSRNGSMCVRWFDRRRDLALIISDKVLQDGTGLCSSGCGVLCVT